MKSFSKSTILVLTFGLLLAGYAVFAFTLPTQAPPGGNVPAPLNTGPETQTKQGGLTTGEVRANTLCIGGACKTSWPLEQRPGDIGAIGWAAYGTTSPVCSSPPSRNLCGCEGPNSRAGCNWWAGTHRGPASSMGETDPRTILSLSNSYSSCYTGWGTYPNCQTTPLDYTASFQCSSPWSASQDGLTSNIASACGWAWQSFPFGCIAAYCRYQ